MIRAVIQHVPGPRAAFVRSIVAAIPSARVVTCTGQPMQTFLTAIQTHDDGHWHLEDDAILAPDFMTRAQSLARLGCLVRGFAQSARSGWMPASSYLFNQCVYLPPGYGRAIAAWFPCWSRAHAHPTGFDMLIRDFLVSRRERYWLEAPSLVQHAPVDSLLGARSRRRRSSTFDERYGAP